MTQNYCFEMKTQKQGFNFLRILYRSRDGTVVRALATYQRGPGLIPPERHMCVEFVVGSRPCSARFFSGYSSFLLSSKPSIFKFQFNLESEGYRFVSCNRPLFKVTLAKQHQLRKMRTFACKGVKNTFILIFIPLYFHQIIHSVK